VAGYSRLMAADEKGTDERLKAHRGELADPKISVHSGLIVRTTGDSSGDRLGRVGSQVGKTISARREARPADDGSQPCQVEQHRP
jgi:class 3 adenylate cyclase